VAVGGRRWVAVGAASALIVGTLPVFLLLRGGAPSTLQGAGTLTAMGGQAISTTRASTKMCARSDGGLVQLANDTPCVDSLGLYVENGATNIALQSGALQTTPWADGTNSALSTDTLAMWRLDDSGGTTVNATGTQDLTKYGVGTSVSVSPGAEGTARNVTTSASLLSSTAVTQAVVTQLATGQFTASMWVRPAADNTGGPVLLFNNGLSWSSVNNDMVVLWMDYDEVNHSPRAYSFSNATTNNGAMEAGNNTMPVSVWTEATLTAEAPDGGNRLFRWFINGVNTASFWKTAPTLTPVGNHYWGLGAYTDVSGVGNPASKFHGDFDDVRVLNVVPTDPQIAGMVDAGFKTITATANAAGARDGTTTATKLDFPGAFSRMSSIWTQAFTGTAAIYTAAVDVQAVSGTPTLYLSLNNGSTYYRSTCTPNSSSLTRCSVTSSVALTAATWTFQVGSDTGDASQAIQPAQSVYVSGAQIETSSVPTSYIPTTASTAARSGELVLTGAISLPGTTYSLSGDFTPQGFGSASGDIININTDSGEEIYAKLNATGGANTMDCGALAGGTFATTTTATFTTGVTSHFSCSYDGVNLVACVGGSCVSAAKAFTRSVLPYARAFLMNDSTLTGRPTVPGHLSNLCVAATPSGCR
jgi:hypothetical protein